jgi:peptidoglycan biosynthesis protein MviN/MurJ (putative lipid II flippase)
VKNNKLTSYNFFKYGTVNFIVKAVSYIRILFVANFIGLSKELDYFFLIQSLIFIFVYALNDVNDSIVLKYLNSKASKFENKSKNILILGSALSILFSIIFLIIVIKILPHLTTNLNISDKISMLISFSLIGQTISTPIIGLIGAIFRIRGNYSYFQNTNLILTFLSVFLFLITPKNVFWLCLTSSFAYLIALLYLLIIYFKKHKETFIFSFSSLYYFKSYLTLMPIFYLLGIINFLERNILANFGPGYVSSLGISVMLLSAPYVFLKLEDTFLPKIMIKVKDNNFWILDSFLKKIIVLTFIYSLFLLFFSNEIVNILFHYGKFSQKNADTVSTLIKMYFFAPVYLTIWPFMYRYSQVLVKSLYLNIIVITGIGFMFFPYFLSFIFFDIRFSILLISTSYIILIVLSYLLILKSLSYKSRHIFLKYFFTSFIILFLFSILMLNTYINNFFIKSLIFIVIVSIFIKLFLSNTITLFKKLINE